MTSRFTQCLFGHLLLNTRQRVRSDLREVTQMGLHVKKTKWATGREDVKGREVHNSEVFPKALVLVQVADNKP